MSRPPWLERDVLLLEEMWTERNERGELVYSASQIGLALGVSRNAVIGKAHRLKLVSRKAAGPIIKQTHKGEKKPVPVAVRKPIPKPTIEEVIAVSEPEPQPKIDGQPVGILPAHSRQCRSVLDQRGDDGLALFCGALTEAGESFCPAHQKLYYVAGYSRRKWFNYDGGTSTPSQSPPDYTGTAGASKERSPRSSDQSETPRGTTPADRRASG